MEHRDQNPWQPSPDKCSLNWLHHQHQTSDFCLEIPSFHLKPVISRLALACETTVLWVEMGCR